MPKSREQIRAEFARRQALQAIEAEQVRLISAYLGYDVLRPRWVPARIVPVRDVAKAA